MSLFFEACELVKKGDIEKLSQLINEHDINIEEKDNLLLLIAAQNCQLDMIGFLLKNGADATSRYGEWFKYVYIYTSWENFEYCFVEYIYPTQLKHQHFEHNLFDVGNTYFYQISQYNIDFFKFFTFLVDQNYPMSYDCAFDLTVNIKHEHVDYLKKVGKFEAYIRRAFHLNFNQENRFKTEDDFYSYIQSKYETFPYYLSPEVKEMLEKKDFDALRKEHSLALFQFSKVPLDLLQMYATDYPDFIDYILTNCDFNFIFMGFDIEQLKIMLRGQDLRSLPHYFTYNAQNLSEDILNFIVSHAKLNDDILFDLFYTGTHELQESIISQYDETLEKKSLEYLAYLAHMYQLPSIRKKLNSSLLDIQFIDATINNDLEQVKICIENGANINCESHSALAISINQKNKELTQYIGLNSEINSRSFYLILKTEQIEFIDFYLEHNFLMTHNIRDIFELKNEVIAQHIFKIKENEIKNILFNGFSFHQNFDLNLSSCLFLSEFFEQLKEEKLNFCASLLHKMLLHSSHTNSPTINESMKSLYDSFSNVPNAQKYVCFSYMDNFIQSDNLELLRYCVDKGYINLNTKDYLGNIHAYQMSEQMAQYFLSHIDSNNTHYETILDNVFSGGYINLFNSFTDSHYDFCAFFIKNFKVLEYKPLIYSHFFDYLFEKITYHQKDKLSFLEEKACEMNTEAWKAVQEKIQSYYEKERLDSLISPTNMNIESKKTGKI